MNFSFRLLCGCALLSTAAAQTIPEIDDHADPVHLGEFVITTHPYARSSSEIAQPTTVVAEDAMDQNPSTSLGQLLANQPGVSSTYFGPGSSRPIIRALGGPRVSVLQNGSDTLDASVLSPDHAVSLDPLLIERVEITRGPAALLQGGAAIGGAVNVVTHRIHTAMPEPGIHGRMETRYDSNNDETSYGALFEGSVGRLAWHVDAFSRDTNNVEIPGYAESARLRAAEEAEHEDEDHDEEEEDHEEAYGFIPNSFVEADGGALGLSWIGDQGYLGAAYSTFDTLYGVPPGAHSHEHEEEEGEDHDEAEHEHEEELVSIRMKQHRWEAQGEWREPFTGLEALRFKASTADYQHQELEGDAIGTTFTNEGYDLRLDALHASIGDLHGAIGAKFGESDFDAIGDEAFLPRTITRTSALYLFEEIEQGANLWQLGGRHEWQSIRTRDGTGRRHSDGATSGSFGWVRDLGHDWLIAASVARTERIPTAQELYADGPHIGTNAYEVGDDTLDTETSTGIDLSLRRRAGWISGELTVFLNRFDGYVYENPTGEEEDGLPVYAFVQRDAEFTGAELSTTFHLHEDEHGHLDLVVSGDLVHARNTTDHTDLPRTTPARLRAALDWERAAWRAGLDVNHVLEQDRTAPSETPTDAYTLLGAYAGYRWLTSAVTWDLLLRGTNLGDEEARLHTSFLKEVVPLPGRSLNLSLRASF